MNPTLGAFGFTQAGKYETEYIYSYGDDYSTYKFQYPNVFPGPPPAQDSGVHWDVQEGIGAGPILLKQTNIISANV